MSDERVLDLPTADGAPAPLRKPAADAWKIEGGTLDDARLSDWTVKKVHKHAINGPSGSNETLGEVLIILLERR